MSETKSTTRKVVKLPAASAEKTVKAVTLKHVKETKGTHVYGTDAEDAFCNQVYIRKSAFAGAAPESVTLSIAY